MNSKLKQLKKSVLADGIIDAEEVKMIQKFIYEDGIIDKQEADFLFELNDAVSGKKNDPSWGKLMVKAITSYLLDDEISPNEVDDKEAAWLISKIEKDGVYDAVEKAIVANIKKKAKKISPILLKKMKNIK